MESMVAMMVGMNPLKEAIMVAVMHLPFIILTMDTTIRKEPVIMEAQQITMKKAMGIAKVLRSNMNTEMLVESTITTRKMSTRRVEMAVPLQA
jgi:hypothetical protein